jgi:hypothetical protein
MCYNRDIATRNSMKLDTAIKNLKLDADFLGMDFFDFVKFVRDNPMAQTQKTIEAYAVYRVEQLDSLSKFRVK